MNKTYTHNKLRSLGFFLYNFKRPIETKFYSQVSTKIALKKKVATEIPKRNTKVSLRFDSCVVCLKHNPSAQPVS